LEGLQVADRTLQRLLSDVVVSCNNAPACDWTGPSGNVDEHLQRMCPFALVPCANAHRGCQKQTARRDAAAHAATCFLADGELLLSKPSTLRGVSEELRMELREKETQLRERDVRLLQLHGELQSRNRTIARLKWLVCFLVAALAVIFGGLKQARFSFF
jgi:hypothetical protein